MDYNNVAEQIAQAVAAKLTQAQLTEGAGRGVMPLGISNRHVHISQAHLEKLFGAGAALTADKELSQPGQYACREKVILAGPRGVVEGVRLLGPVRRQTQVEITQSDCFKLGIAAPVRDSGDTAGSAGLTLVGPKGAVTLTEGVIIAARHIHMTPADAAEFGVRDGERVTAAASGPRGLLYRDVLVRVSPSYRLEMHLDTDEANAASLKTGDKITIL